MRTLRKEQILDFIGVLFRIFGGTFKKMFSLVPTLGPLNQNGWGGSQVSGAYIFLPSVS